MDIVDLINRTKQGDNEAFGQLYDCFAQKIFRYIRLKIQDRQEAEDILQEVFIKTYQGLGTLKLDDLNFNGWLYKVTSNTMNDHFRKHYSHPESVELTEDLDPPAQVSLQGEISDKWDAEMARAAFTKLPILYRQVLELRFVQDLSLEEVAKIIGKSNLAVRLIQHRALKKVRIILKQESHELN